MLLKNIICKAFITAVYLKTRNVGHNSVGERTGTLFNQLIAPPKKQEDAADHNYDDYERE